MRLERQTVFLVQGVATLPAATVPVVTRMRRQLMPIGVTGRLPGLLSAVVTRDVDGGALSSDRRIALANLLLRGGLPRIQQPDQPVGEIQAIRDLRRQRHPDGLFLITEVSRSIRSPVSQPALGVVHGTDFDLIVEGPMVSGFRDFQWQAHEVEMVLLGALRLTADDDLRHEEVQSATYLLSRTKRPEYRMWIDAGSLEIRRALNITNQSAQRMRRDAARILRSAATRPLRLVGAVSSVSEDATVEFLVSFTALEQYVKEQTAAGGLVRRFMILASQRYPVEAARHVAEFESLYRVRNELAHEGQIVGDRSLAQRVRTLLAQYLM